MISVSQSAWFAIHAAIVAFGIEQWPSAPHFETRDAYKWLFHATLGGEHAITNRAAVARWLDREWDAISKPREGEPMSVPLTPGGSLVRVNLRPYKASGRSKSALLDAFVASANEFRGDKSSFIIAWRLLGETLRSKPKGSVTIDAWRSLDREMSALAYPATHHSEAYERAESPAYRVLTGERAKAILGATSPGR